MVEHDTTIGEYISPQWNGCASKNGIMSSVVALKGAALLVLGHECPRPLTVYPLTTARLSDEHCHDLAVVDLCGCETLGSSDSVQPSRSAHASR